MRYCLCLSYDGAEFCGWQIQPNAPSVQACLEEVLSRLLQRPVAVTGAGRTDTSVNAVNYVAHFDWDGSFPFEASDFTYKLNAMLPRSVVVHEAFPVPPDFHARFSARRREYTYFIHRQKDPFLRSYSWYCGYPELDFDAMNQACRYLLGMHDYSCFEKTGGDNKTSLCTVMDAFWAPYTPSHIAVMGRGGIAPGTCAPPHEGRGRGFGKTEEGVAVQTSGHPRPDKGEGPTKREARVFGRGREATVCTAIPSAVDTGYWYFRIAADRFLRNMVRATVGSLIEVGRGKHRPEWIAELIESGTRGDAGESVPGHALFLNQVSYYEE